MAEGSFPQIALYENGESSCRSAWTARGDDIEYLERICEALCEMPVNIMVR